MRLLKRTVIFTIISLFVMVGEGAQVVRADGTEVLGPPSITIATGTGVVAGGVGLEGTQPANIDLNVPLGVTVKQVLLYWSGGAIGAGNAGDNTVTVNGVSVTGTLIGGPTYFFNRGANAYYFSTYRADITSLGVVVPGANSIAISGMNFGADENNGAGILAIIDNGSTAANIQLRDGLDLAFINFPEPRRSTIAQTFTFASAAVTRTATIPMFFGSIQRNGVDVMRPNAVDVTVGGVTTRFSDKLNSHDGPEWDTFILSIPIPPGATSLTVQAFSRDDFNTTRLPASFSWLASMFVLPAQQIASLGDYVWEDLNRDGVQEFDEPGIPNVPVTLLDCNNPANTLATTTTNAGGYYLFDNLTPGCYEVQFGRPAGFVFTDRNVGSNEAIDSDADPVTGRSGQVTLGPGEQNLTVDAGLWRSGSSIVLKKYTNGEDADLPTGPEVGFGDTVTWTYDITNTGTVTLSNVTLVDNIEGSVSCPLTTLLPGQTMTCVLTGVATTLGQYANTAIVTGTPTLFPTQRVTDTNPSHYLSRPFSLGNRVWRDDGEGGGVANDGVQNGGESGIAGVTVNLLDGNGNPVLGPNNQPLSLVTAADGCFVFQNLRSGNYILEVAASNFASGQPLAGHISSTGNSVGGLAPSPNTDIDLDDNGNDVPVNGAIRTGIVTLSLNSEPLNEQLCGPGNGTALDQNSNLTVDFGFLAPVSVGDFVWFDNNRNGIQDPGEGGVSNIGVSIFTAAGQTVVDLAGNPVPPQTTDANGNYLFTNLPPGSYYVVFDRATLPAGYVITIPNVGTDREVDSDPDPATGRTPPTPFLPGGSVDLSVDMGIFELQHVRIGDFVWRDDNVNGQQDPGERGVGGVTVRLYDAATDQELAVTQTGTNGRYIFDDLDPGQYYVVFDLSTLPTGYKVTTPNAPGVSDELDSDADPITGRTGNSRVLAAGEEDLSLDMGVYVLLSVGDLVWIDEGNGSRSDPRFNNGLFNPEVESGFPGIPVRLYITRTQDITLTLVATTTTDANGNYRFDGLLPGNYVLQITVPPTYTSSNGGVYGQATGPFEPGADPNNNVDNDDNGTSLANPQVIRTAGARGDQPVTLSVGDEPAENGLYNPTVDFGVCLGCTRVTTDLDPSEEPGVYAEKLFLPFVAR